MSKVIIVTTITDNQLAFHVDRLFAVHCPFVDEKNDQRFDLVVALRTVEPNGIALVPVKGTFEELIYQWNECTEKNNGTRPE